MFLSTERLKDLPDTVRAELQQLYHAGIASNLRAVAELRRIAPVLDAAAVPWAVVKGPVLSEFVYSRSDLRDYIDLDVVVAPEGLGLAYDALEAIGFILRERSWRHLRVRFDQRRSRRSSLAPALFSGAPATVPHPDGRDPRPPPPCRRTGRSHPDVR